MKRINVVKESKFNKLSKEELNASRGGCQMNYGWDPRCPAYFINPDDPSEPKHPWDIFKKAY